MFAHGPMSQRCPGSNNPQYRPSALAVVSAVVVGDAAAGGGQVTRGEVVVAATGS